MDKVVHFEIPASNLQRAKKFYKGIFGWKTQDIPEMKYVMVHTVAVGKDRMPKEKGAINGGMMKKNNIVKAPVVTIHVKNINLSLGKIKKMGGKVMMEKTSIGEMGSIAYFKDSEQNVIGLFEGMM